MRRTWSLCSKPYWGYSTMVAYGSSILRRAITDLIKEGYSFSFGFCFGFGKKGPCYAYFLCYPFSSTSLVLFFPWVISCTKPLFPLYMQLKYLFAVLELLSIQIISTSFYNLVCKAMFFYRGGHDNLLEGGS